MLLDLAISFMNIFTLILDYPEETHNMYFKDLIDSQQGGIFSCLSCSIHTDLNLPYVYLAAWSIVSPEQLKYPESRCGRCIFKQTDTVQCRYDAFIYEINYTGT